ncbi:hypothetical protein [Nostoc sp.]|uniref:hypothetical protein n=1 Tax=Nostoc sp. TaxID=1180 RepID=UPI002FFAEBC6
MNRLLQMWMQIFYSDDSYLSQWVTISTICTFWFNQKLNLGIDQHKIFVAACNTS